jgi:hypothetical protein
MGGQLPFSSRRKNMFDWSDPNTLWLNITDIALGIVTLACLAFVAQAAFREVYARLANRLPARLHEDSHAFHLPELGLTMADGGEPVKPEKKDDRRKP